MNRDIHRLDPAFDPRIADWLEADPDSAPRETLDTILAALPSIQQRRAPRVPWRSITMNRFAPIGAAAVFAIVLVGGALLLIRPGGGGVGTLPTASPSASSSPSASIQSPAPSPGLGACDLVTSDQAERLAGIVGLGALPTESGTGNETTCLYNDGGNNIVLRVTYTKSGGAAAFETAQAVAGVQPVADLGDGAVFDPATSMLYVRKGDALVAIFAGAFGQDPDTRLASATAIAEVAVERMARLIPDGTYQSAPMQVADIQAEINADQQLSADEKASLASTILGLEGLTTIQVEITVNGDELTMLVKRDDGPFEPDTTWTITSTTDSTITASAPCCGSRDYEVAWSDGALSMRGLTPLSSVEAAARRVLFESGSFAPTS
jgi:hypothetical protein